MGGSPVSGIGQTSSPSGSWKLAPSIAADTQALVLAGFSELPASLALFLHAGQPGGAWLKALLEAAPVTTAAGKSELTVAFALTRAGLDILGAGAIAAEFAQPFVEGMFQKDRRRRLGDADATGALPAEIQWSGNALDGAPTSVHALLLLYHADHDALAAHAERIKTVLDAAGVAIVRRQRLDIRCGPDGIAREHFGFADGISQPIPYGEGTRDEATGQACRPDPVHGVPLGEVLLGYPDAHSQRNEGPVLAGTSVGGGRFSPLAMDQQQTSVDVVAENATTFDLGRNGSYLVVRELRQDVDGFWRSLAAEAKDLNARYPDRPPVDATWLAARVVGRTLDGDMIGAAGPLPPFADSPDNRFLFFQRDRLGLGCPLGAHVRRANPRDGLAFDATVCADLLRSANAHRIMRRGRKFGGDVNGGDVNEGGAAGNTDDRGLLFMCLNTDIARQFEFIQQNWMLNPNFATLYDEVDPLVGPAGPMSLPDRPARRRVDVDTYVTLVGGDYFFLPSVSALAVLAALPPPATP